MKPILFALGLLLAPLAALAGGNAPLHDAVELRMLSQRMAKAYCQLGLNLLPGDARQQLDGAVATTNQLLDRLRRGGDRPVVSQVARINTIWLRLRPLLSDRVDREATPQVVDDAEEMLAASDGLARLLEVRSAPHGRQYVAAARLRMLSQRIVKAYLLQQWGIAAVAQREQIDVASREFEATLDGLRTAPQTTPQLRQEIDELGLQWEWFRTALQTEGALSFRLIILESSEAILSAADRVAELYAPPAAR